MPFSPRFRSRSCSVGSRKFYVAFDERSERSCVLIEEKMDKNNTISIMDNSNNNNKTHYYTKGE